MSELAFNEDGQRFQLPATVVRWRTRRFNNPGKPGGAQVVYGEDGLPLFLDVEATAEEFRDAVGGVPGRYRLDGVDAQSRVVEGVPPAYLMINGPTAASSGGAYSAPPPASSSLEYALVEMARANSDAIKSVADKFGSMCDSMANVIRATDGAGLPRRAPLGPLLVDRVDRDEDDEEDDDERNAAPPPAPPPAPQATIATILGQVMQVMQMFAQMSGGNGAKLGAVMGQVVETAKVVETVVETSKAPEAPPATGKPTEEGDDDVPVSASAKAPAANGTHATHGAQREPARVHPSSSGEGRVVPTGATGMAATGASVTSAPRAGDPTVQFQQIMTALTPQEQAQVQYVIATLSVRDLLGWYEQLASMPVAEGVAKIRAELARIPTEHAA